VTYQYRTLRRIPGFDGRRLDALSFAGIEGAGYGDGTGRYKVKVGSASPEAAAGKLNAHLGILPEIHIALTADDMRPAG
jgi:hypothetical protein